MAHSHSYGRKTFLIFDVYTRLIATQRFNIIQLNLRIGHRHIKLIDIHIHWIGISQDKSNCSTGVDRYTGNKQFQWFIFILLNSTIALIMK